MKNTYLFIALIIIFVSCGIKKDNHKTKVINVISSQLKQQINSINFDNKIKTPRTINKDNTTKYITTPDWTCGFFPGTIWKMYQLTGDDYWKKCAIPLTESLSSAQYLKWHHDVGFIIECSYGNAFRLIHKPEYKTVIINAARSLSTRFRENAGIIQSWNVDKGWQAERGWMCPVIIDNMMNLKLLFDATKYSGDSIFYKIAVSHALKTIENHFRPNYSSYHVVDYNPKTGEVRAKQTAQGYADESSWARGQSWALYGFVECYRETGIEKFKIQAQNIAKYIMQNSKIPKDNIPLWDYDAQGKYDKLRDVSAAAVTASALYDFYSLTKNKDYKNYADKIIDSLSSDKYMAKVGENNNFILMHSVGSIPHNAEIDVPLNYADYYFLEALCRKKELK